MQHIIHLHVHSMKIYRLMDTDPSKVRAQAYDLVLNGYELGGGSLRIYSSRFTRKNV